MRIKKSYEVHLAPNEIIGHFGQVRLVKKGNEKHELVGGTVNAQAAVRTWCGFYASFIIFAEPTGHELALAA